MPSLPSTSKKGGKSFLSDLFVGNISDIFGGEPPFSRGRKNKDEGRKENGRIRRLNKAAGVQAPGSR